MKIAAGCFGCLALFLLMFTMVLAFGGAAITTAISEADPSAGSMFAGMIGTLQMVLGSCCCLSGVAAIGLFAVGSSGNKDSVE